MNCLAQRKKFKNKHPVWSDPSEPQENEVEKPVEIDIQKEDDSGSNSESEDDEFDMYANDVRSKKLSLETKELQYKHLTNLNNEQSYKGVIKQVQFHPKSKIALVSLSFGQADLFEVDGERNRYIQNIKLPRTKTPFCSFKPDGESIVISSEDYRGAFYTYDMVTAVIQKYSHKVGSSSKEMTDFTLFGDHMACRKEGSQEINVLSSKTFENTFSIKINEPVKVIKFSSTNEMFIAGQNAHVYIWDLRKTSQCKHRFQDDGSVHATSMSISEKSKLLSIGSDSGILNTYEIEQCMTTRYPSPIKTYSNLKTELDVLNYNPTGELLLFGSSKEIGSFRIAHSHSGSVYKNFPVPNKKYGHLISTDFSPLGGYLSLGCSNGRAYLCRIPYYKSY